VGVRSFRGWPITMIRGVKIAEQIEEEECRDRDVCISGTMSVTIKLHEWVSGKHTAA
jgi:methanogenic corrinoid protein MtbC1